MDIVFIRGLEVRAIIGVRDWERQVKQTVVLNLEMETDVEAAAATDDIHGTLSYSDVAKALETFVGNSSFQLIETLAEQIAALVMAEFGVGWLRLELIKPRPLSGRHVVGVVIERGVRVAERARVGTATTDRPAPPAPG
jgi:7,8-dihydroneopterin aldolase/epimerase/oxygenase